MNELIKFLQESATALKEKDPTLSAKFAAQAVELEKATASNSIAKQVEDTIAARIKSGDLFPKASFESAVADAKKAGADEVTKAHEAKVAEEKKVAEVTASRMKEVTEAKLNPKLPMHDGRTLEETVASFPANEEGDKSFKLIVGALASQIKESGVKPKEETASDKSKKLNPLGGRGAADGSKKKSFL